MDEYQTWLYMAELWDNAKPDECGYFIAGPGLNGLCNTLGDIYAIDKIDKTLYVHMWNVLDKVPKLEAPYCWPKDAAGAKSRAQFCRDMAERTGKIV